MIAEIIVKEARQNRIDGFVFVEFKNVLSASEVPWSYLCKHPNFWYADNLLKVDPQKDCEILKFKKGDFISEKDFHELIRTLKQAGQRLTDINKKQKNDWIGDKKIIITI